VELTNLGQLETIIQVALTHPTSLQQLREVRHARDLGRSLIESFVQPANAGKAFYEAYFKVKLHRSSNDLSTSCIFFILQLIYKLLTCCKNLNKVIISSSFVFSRSALESRYLATIEAIGPDVIEFRMPGLKIANLVLSDSNESEDSD
jgi:hypothetical protein